MNKVMKKALLIAVIAVCGAALAVVPSCKKKSGGTTYTCWCEAGVQKYDKRTGVAESDKNEGNPCNGTTPFSSAAPRNVGTIVCQAE
jgi:hypothetical protein